MRKMLVYTPPFIYLYQYVFMDICFIFWVIMQYQFVAQIVLVLAIRNIISWL